MATGHRLSALDTSFLHLENSGAHMHVASVTIFEGPPPRYVDLLAHLDARLHLVPRFRQRLAKVPFDQGRPVLVDDPHFNLRYHLRHTGLPAPGSPQQLKALAGRLFAQALDRDKPLWEMWLVDRLGTGADAGADAAAREWNRAFALITKTHHALVDGVSGADITAVLFDTVPEPVATAAPARPWTPRPLPSKAQLLGDALLERATQPGEAIRGVRAFARTPRKALSAVRTAVAGVGALAFADQAPPTPLNVPIGSHRRYEWVDADLAQFKAIKNALGGSVNDVVLAVVAGALGRYLRHGGVATDDLVLKAMVPVSVRSEAQQGALGNRVAAMWAPLPVGIADPVEQLHTIRMATGDLKQSGQAIGAQTLTELVDFAPPTILSQAARLQSRQRFFNLVVTNVPGPQMPLYLLGRRLRALYPVVPLARNQALGIAVMSYDGRLGFGLLGDFDAMGDLDVLADALRDSIDALRAAAGTGGGAGNGARATRRRRARPAAPSPA